MARPRIYKESESSLLKRVDPCFMELYDKMEKDGEVRTFPEFTRRIVRELKETRLKDKILFPRLFR